MPVGPKTTWDDLGNLGWHKQQVYDLLNSVRGHTMHNLSDLSLNESLSEEFKWYCYNVLKGNPTTKGPVLNTAHSNKVVWEYDNTKNSKPFKDTWKETWTEKETASLTITHHASINLSSSVDIQGIASTSLSMSISTESNKTEHKESSHQLSHSWVLEVGPHEKLQLVRVITTTTGSQIYSVPFGLDADNDWIGTKGDKYNDHWNWAYKANNYLHNPSGTLQITGNSTSTAYRFNLVRTKKEGHKLVETLDLPTEALNHETEDTGKAQAA